MLTQWLTRPNNILNRATGLNYTLTGTAPTNTTGPDGANYGLSFVSGASYLGTDNAKTTLSLCLWAKLNTGVTPILKLIGADAAHSMVLSPNGISGMLIDVGSNSHSFLTPVIGTSWVNVWVVYNGTNTIVYANGVLVENRSGYTGVAMGGNGIGINFGAGSISLYDIRLSDTAIAAAAIAYYYDQVINNTGVKILPQI